jgi:hypothetical protein
MNDRREPASFPQIDRSALQFGDGSQAIGTAQEHLRTRHHLSMNPSTTRPAERPELRRAAFGPERLYPSSTLPHRTLRGGARPSGCRSGAGGHIAGLAVWDDAMMIDLSIPPAVRVDPRPGPPKRSAVRCEATSATRRRVRLGDARRPQPHDAIAGFTLGGGFGELSRAFGLACDNLLEMGRPDDGRRGCAVSDENADLFWGLRGGGGNFAKSRFSSATPKLTSPATPGRGPRTTPATRHELWACRIRLRPLVDRLRLPRPVRYRVDARAN